MGSYAFERSGGPATTKIESLIGVQSVDKRMRFINIRGTTWGLVSWESRSRYTKGLPIAISQRFGVTEVIHEKGVTVER